MDPKTGYRLANTQREVDDRLLVAIGFSGVAARVPLPSPAARCSNGPTRKCALLPPEAVDRLREVARKLLRTSAEFQ